LCQQELLDSFVQFRHDSRAAFRRAFAWSGWLGTRPWFFDKWTPRGESPATPAEVALLNYVLDKAALQERPMEELPSPVLEKLLALQKAAEALQGLSAGHSQAGDKKRALPGRTGFLVQSTKAALATDNVVKLTNAVDETPRVTIGFAELDSSDSQPVHTMSESRNNSPAKPGDRQAEGALRHGGEQPASAGSPPDFPKQAWYMLTLIWGAVLACILAPLVIDVIKKRKKGGRRGRPQAAYAVPFFVVPRPLDLGRQEIASIPMAIDDQTVLEAERS
jgi:hypothetical protein